MCLTRITKDRYGALFAFLVSEEQWAHHYKTSSVSSPLAKRCICYDQMHLDCLLLTPPRLGGLGGALFEFYEQSHVEGTFCKVFSSVSSRGKVGIFS